ncbi:MAG: PspC domain-containing protein [Microlunatus sp.]
MSTPYPPQPRRLMRDPSNKLIGGVCSGVAKYLNMDVNLVRILAVVIALFTGVPIILYLIALFVLPEEGTQPPPPPHVNGPQAGGYGAPGGYGQPWQQQAYGEQAPAAAPTAPPASSPTPGPDPVWGADGAPWEQPQPPASAPAPESPKSPESAPRASSESADSVASENDDPEQRPQT